MTFCTCWRDYPNEAHKKRNGKWRCVDSYKCVRKGNGYKVKTKCEKVKGGQINDKDIGGGLSSAYGQAAEKGKV